MRDPELERISQIVNSLVANVHLIEPLSIKTIEIYSDHKDQEKKRERQEQCLLPIDW